MFGLPSRPCDPPMSYTNLFDLSDKVALVTGSTRGIGRAIADALATWGARVVISSRHADRCAEVAADVGKAGGTALAAPADLADKRQLDPLVKRILDHWGRIDVLVCNVSINPCYGPLANVSEPAYAAVIETNLTNTLRLCNLVIPQMAERDDGVVIIVSSTSALRGQDKLGVYAVSKAAQIQLARNLAVEWGPRCVRVNCLVPGLVRTDFARAIWDDPRLYRDAVAASPLGRIADPQDIGGAAVFLASNAGRHITGQTLVIDGGTSISAKRRR